MDVDIAELQEGPLHRFADWPNRDIPRLPGVYSVFSGTAFIYVGMAGRGVQVEDIDDEGQAKTNSQGLLGRLRTHANGKRSGDQFCVYVCDRFVVPDLTSDVLALLRGGANTLLDDLTKTYIRQHFQYRYVVCRSGKEASTVEDAVKAGALPCGPPLLNPGKAVTARES
ncbi:hypothetical protein [Mycobacterium montefiorense]|uniref:hypothetical protein n=1 Tax=Mycobacterium montefiorense TaxID=154654 RepID=UPI0021F31792|nr:hypothetical protein [Mycobacterium montefiorense]MCV7428156.1 hypothetical protein [Mycobacterium montefiorense]